MKRPNTLVINISDSSCGACGRGASPHETQHDTVLSYSGQSKGCGEKWTKVDTDYVGVNGLNESIKAMRPDLEPTGLLVADWPIEVAA